VRVRVIAFEGWCFGRIVADETKSKRLLMENRFGFDSLSGGFRYPLAYCQTGTLSIDF